MGHMGRGSARWVHTRIRHQPVALTPVTPYPTGRRSGPLSSSRPDVHSVQRGSGCDKEPVSLRTTKCEIGHRFRDQDFPQANAVWCIAVHTILRASPDVTGHIKPEPVRYAGRNLRENLSSTQPSVSVHREHTYVMFTFRRV